VRRRQTFTSRALIQGAERCEKLPGAENRGRQLADYVDAFVEIVPLVVVDEAMETVHP